MKEQVSIEKVAELLRELRRLGVKRAEYNLRSPWQRPVPKAPRFVVDGFIDP